MSGDLTSFGAITGPRNIIEAARAECVSLETRVNELVRGTKVRVKSDSRRLGRTTLAGRTYVILRVHITNNPQYVLALATLDAPNAWYESCGLEDVEFVA